MGLCVEHDQTDVGAKADLGGRTTRDAIDDNGAEEVFYFAVGIGRMIDDQSVVGAKVEGIEQGVVAEGTAPIAGRDGLLSYKDTLLLVVAQQTLSHGRCPQHAALVFGKVIDVAGGVLLVFDEHMAKDACLGVDDTAALAVGADPEAVMLILVDLHDGRGDRPRVGGAGEVMTRLAFGIEAEQTSIVGAYPEVTIVVAKERGDAAVAHGVVAKGLGTIIMEIDGIVGDDEDSLLIECHPDVAIA